MIKPYKLPELVKKIDSAILEKHGSASEEQRSDSFTVIET
jgi:hypothetical protein